MEKFAGRRLDPINMIGGGANSNVWCQIFADVFDRTIRQVRDPIQANARGAGFLALVALGYLTFDEVSERIQIAHTYEPNPKNRKIYDELFQEFVNIFKSNKKIYSRLSPPLSIIAFRDWAGQGKIIHGQAMGFMDLSTSQIL